MLNKSKIYLLTIIACLFPIALRSLLIGGPPCTDEGIYAFWSQITFHTLTNDFSLPKEGGLLLYPTITSGAFFSQDHALLILRVTDAIAAGALGATMFLLMYFKTRNPFVSLFLSITTAYIINDQPMVNYGYKHSIIIAIIPLLWSFYFIQKEDNTNLKYFLGGVLIAISTMLREPFVIFPLIGTFFIISQKKYKSTLLYISGGIFMIALILSTYYFLGKTPADILHAYKNTSKLYQNLNHKIFDHVVIALEVASTTALSIIPILYLILITLYKMYQRKTFYQPRELILWFAVFLSPLLEVFSKIGFAYHFIISVVGIWGITYTLSHNIEKLNTRRTLMALATCSIILCALRIPHWSNEFLFAKKFAPVMVFNDWSADITNSSTHLLIARQIREEALKDDKILVSGGFFVIFPLTRLLPPNSSTADLDWMRFESVDIDRVIEMSKPNFIVLANRDSHGFSDHSNLLKNKNSYNNIRNIKIDKDRFYGNWGASIWKMSPPKLSQ